MSDTGWNGEVIETTPVALAPVPSVAAQVARMIDRPHHIADDGGPMLRRFSPRQSHWPEIVAHDQRAQDLQARAFALNHEINACRRSPQSAPPRNRSFGRLP